MPFALPFTTAPSPNRLSALPAELRLIIYELVLATPEASLKTEPILMQTSKTIRREMIPQYLKHCNNQLKEKEKRVHEQQASVENAAKTASTDHERIMVFMGEIHLAYKRMNITMHEGALKMKKDALEREDLRTESALKALYQCVSITWEEATAILRLRV
ncbi:hypothetical protein CLAFUW4_14215 [Fulvia fulva]|uniref:Uncharacterized protein n=1 Tax=Passalora fulva TaxID=5499 RepID=A0A9Q8PL86_PASFU|nr:uncharacterized protein CLAFUR5_14048 [Fulvia fulva]KAK4610135.1 hypothetical protein CLAFUR4_14218 [Fulvia fulva]KAK4611172.1 hypothetical protein CLAFUR0_14223 [Fulvia fulva]UJO24467.1 hypothetical protein CLAFUR5_14048 [Fulvia fulva]WPV22081.1 hypothetical protein CLAFUW4_14215 [Fulvia fulva]WPV37011.1 hypothetical protein CLAFUW7_14226 [Fulvia fulva]